MRRTLLLFGALVLVACGAEPPPPPQARPTPLPTAKPEAGPAPVVDRYGYPPTRRKDVTDTLFGVRITDPYRWLEDGSSPEVKAWAHAEDTFARARLAKLPERDAIAKRLAELFYVETESPPDHEGNRWFWSHRAPRQEKSVVYWRQGKKGKPKVLLDPNAWSDDGSVSLGHWDASLDGKRVAYNQKSNNSDEATMHVIDVASGKVSSVDVIKGTKYSGASWTPKGDGFYYTYTPPADGHIITVADRPGFAEVRFHKLGTDPAQDAVVHERTGDPKTFIGSEISRDGHFLLTYLEHGWTSTDVFYKDLRHGTPKAWTPLVKGQPHKYEVWVWKDRFYVRTDDGAENYHIFKVDPAKPDRKDWVEIVPERKDATLHSFNIVGNHLALSYLKDVVSHLEVHDLDGKLVREVKLPAIGDASVLMGNPGDDDAYYTFESFTYPREIDETSIKTGKTSLYFRMKSPVDPSKFTVEQLFATSKDGTRVPYFVVKPVDFKADGKAKALVYGYGGFLVTQSPYFTSSAYPWLERGGIYVSVNLRGGGEYGEAWHQAGQRHNKQHVFDDLFAVLEKLAKDKYTSASRIAVRGASNGGLLVAAAVTERPDLFRVGLCGVPLVDMLRYQLFGSGKTWIEEYGSADNEADFKALYAYSPYQHVTPGVHYPSLLVLSADSDDRVDPMHARKFVARMQAASAGGPVLLRVEKHSGHGGADLVRAAVAKIADELAFAWDEIDKPRP